MNGAVLPADTERFRAAIARRLGLQFDDAKLGLLGDVLRRRTECARRSAGAYLAEFEEQGLADEVSVLAQELTVPETYFFRNNDQFRAFTEVALPARKSVQVNTRRLSILSAGCASGEEPYSVAILLREALDPSWTASVLGVDINPAMVHRANEGRYSSWALRETPGDVQQRWFRQDGREFVIDAGLRSGVRFEAANLAEDDDRLWQPDSYDVVFFRNVVMYFTREQGQAVMARIARALKPGGFLFLGHAETLRGLSGGFHLQHTHDTFYYQRKDRFDTPDRSSTRIARSRSEDGTLAGSIDGADAWVEAIGRATARIETLTGSTRTPTLQAPARLPATPAWSLDIALDLLRQERFAEASEFVARLPSESKHDPAVLLLSAVLLTHRGCWAEAEQECQRLLDADELNAPAQYLLALCREGALDWPGALNHHQLAVYLDPSFAMPHLRLGLLARQAGDRAGAQRELGHALPLLHREEGSRLLLFGGGFSREALIALCRTELVAAGGRA